MQVPSSSSLLLMNHGGGESSQDQAGYGTKSGIREVCGRWHRHEGRKAGKGEKQQDWLGSLWQKGQETDIQFSTRVLEV